MSHIDRTIAEASVHKVGLDTDHLYELQWRSADRADCTVVCVIDVSDHSHDGSQITLLSALDILLMRAVARECGFEHLSVVYYALIKLSDGSIAVEHHIKEGISHEASPKSDCTVRQGHYS